MAIKILTANDLISGGVVFLTDDCGWSSFISQAQLADDLVTAQRLETIGSEAEAAQQVVGAYLIDILLENDQPHPLRFRERLRVNGPSVRAEFSKPAFSEVA